MPTRDAREAAFAAPGPAASNVPAAVAAVSAAADARPAAKASACSAASATDAVARKSVWASFDVFKLVVAVVVVVIE